MKNLFFNSSLIFIVIAGAFLSLFLFGCVQNKPVILVEKDLPADLPLPVKEGVLKGVYSLEDYAYAQSLIAEGKTGKRSVSPVEFLVEEKRFSDPTEKTAGVFVYDKKNISSLRFFTTKLEPVAVRNNIMSFYSVGKLKEFDKYIFLTATGKFFFNLPDLEVNIYKIKCYTTAGQLRYLTVVNSQINGEDSYGVFYNSSVSNSNMGDVMALFFLTLK